MSDDPNVRAPYQAAGVPATPGYFRALGIRLERGRLFAETDDAQAPPAVIMSADTARRLFGEMAPTDPLSFAAATTGVLAAGLLASYVPAERATRVDPLVGLRAD